MANDIFIRPHLKQRADVGRAIRPQDKSLRDNPRRFECGRTLQQGSSPMFPRTWVPLPSDPRWRRRLLRAARSNGVAQSRFHHDLGKTKMPSTFVVRQTPMWGP